jgi:hypothetical protein
MLSFGSAMCEPVHTCRPFLPSRFRLDVLELGYPHPPIRLLRAALESMESYEKSGVVRTREH